MKQNDGFSLVELIIGVAIFAILAAIAVPNLFKYKKVYEIEDLASKIDYSIKIGKIKAMERTRNTGICIANNTLSVNDIGTDRGAAACSGTTLFQHSMTGATITGTSHKFDPRGVMIKDGLTLPLATCIKNDSGSFRITTYMTSTMMKKEEC